MPGDMRIVYMHFLSSEPSQQPVHRLEIREHLKNLIQDASTVLKKRYK